MLFYFSYIQARASNHRFPFIFRRPIVLSFLRFWLGLKTRRSEKRQKSFKKHSPAIKLIDKWYNCIAKNDNFAASELDAFVSSFFVWLLGNCLIFFSPFSSMHTKLDSMPSKNFLEKFLNKISMYGNLTFPKSDAKLDEKKTFQSQLQHKFQSPFKAQTYFSGPKSDW